VTPLSYVIFANDPIGLLLDILVIVVVVALIVYVVRRLLIVLFVITLIGAFSAKAAETPTISVPANKAVLVRSDPTATRPTTEPSGDNSGTTIVVKPPNQPVILIPSGSPDMAPIAIPVPDSPVWRWLAPLLTLILSMTAAALSIWAKTHATDANERSKNTSDRLAMVDPNAPVFKSTPKV
jgi:hypothetical protein